MSHMLIEETRKKKREKESKNGEAKANSGIVGNGGIREVGEGGRGNVRKGVQSKRESYWEDRSPKEDSST